MKCKMKILPAMIVSVVLLFLWELSLPGQPSKPANVDWPYTSGERRGSHYSPLDQIRSGNVKQLGFAWSYDTATTRGLEATPVVVAGTMFASLSWSVVVALDAATGKLKWRHDPGVRRELGSRSCCDVVNRGVALDRGRVFVGTLDGRLQALDASSGRLLWSVETTSPGQNYTITGAPRVVKGKVIIETGEPNSAFAATSPLMTPPPASSHGASTRSPATLLTSSKAKRSKRP